MLPPSKNRAVTSRRQRIGLHSPATNAITAVVYGIVLGGVGPAERTKGFPAKYAAASCQRTLG